MACGEVHSRSMHRLHLSTGMCAKVESCSKESEKKKKRVADLDEVDVVQEILKKKKKNRKGRALWLVLKENQNGQPRIKYLEQKNMKNLVSILS